MSPKVRTGKRKRTQITHWESTALHNDVELLHDSPEVSASESDYGVCSLSEVQ